MHRRAVVRLHPGLRTLEGGGFEVRRPFPTSGLDQVDPFLLLDEMGPQVWPPGAARGAPDHPHRGFETVTYMMAGAFEHKDSMGNRGVLRPGDVQWMTAGDGVIHSEMPTAEFQASGGRLHGFQLWVNLPAKDKRMRPRYQDIPGARIPVVAAGEARVKVIAGSFGDTRAVIDTRVPITYLHVTLPPGGAVDVPLPAEQAGFVYVFAGTASVSGMGVPEGTLARLGEPPADRSTTSGVALRNGGEVVAEMLVLAAVPLGEPVARHGPFVMNTRAELQMAIDDFRAGRFGKIPVTLG
jgi:redox-sensitive bicupin YhaK (pirin superfamily)